MKLLKKMGYSVKTEKIKDLKRSILECIFKAIQYFTFQKSVYINYCNSREYLPLAIDAITPPSINRSIPVMNDESSLNRNSAALAISSEVPTLFAGDELIIS